MPKTSPDITRFENLLKALDGQITREEFDKKVEQILKLVVEMEKRNQSDRQQLVDDFRSSLQSIKSDTTTSLSDLKKQVNELFVNDRIKEMESKIDKKLASVKDGKSIKGDPGKQGVPGTPGKDANENAIVDRVVKRLQSSLKSQVDEATAKIPKQVQTPAKVYRTNTADLSSQCDGATRTFNVGGMHFGIVGVYGTEFPQIYRPVIDYTETKTGFTLTNQVSAPASGQTLVALFLK